MDTFLLMWKIGAIIMSALWIGWYIFMLLSMLLCFVTDKTSRWDPEPLSLFFGVIVVWIWPISLGFGLLAGAAFLARYCYKKTSRG